ncbi:MAG TPA: DUF2784 family protein [Terriglobales bacterium]|nr:DUF2784 family protein [Terriglobales bacterium]
MHAAVLAPNFYSALAISVLLLHALFILWVVFGALLTCSRPILRWLHVGSLVWGILTELLPWPCPLTLLENRFESNAGVEPDQGGFLLHYLDKLVYPDISSAARPGEAETGHIWATEKTYELFGLSPDKEMNLDKFLALVHPEDRIRVRQAIQQAMRSGGESAVECVLSASLRNSGSSSIKGALATRDSGTISLNAACTSN